MNGKILFVLTSHGQKGTLSEKTGFYLSEASHPWMVLTDAGYQIDYVSPKGGLPPVDGFNLDDPLNREFWTNTQVQGKLKDTLTPDEIDPDDYSCIFYVGGHGAMWDFPDNMALASIASKIYQNGGIIAAVCHGVAGLVNVRLSSGEVLVDDKKVTCFSNEEEKEVNMEDIVPFLLEDKLKVRGADVIVFPNWEANVQVDERLVTGQNPASATTVGMEMLKLLQGVEVM